jgi:hypothetical protein
MIRRNDVTGSVSRVFFLLITGTSLTPILLAEVEVYLRFLSHIAYNIVIGNLFNKNVFHEKLCEDSLFML